MRLASVEDKHRIGRMMRPVLAKGAHRVALIVALGCSLFVQARGDALAAAASAWRFRFVDSVTFADAYGDTTRTSTHVAPSGRTEVLYFDGPLEGGQFDMKVARGPLPDGTFDIESIDPADLELAGYGSLAADSRQRPHVSYISGFFYGEGILKYASRQNQAWQIEVVDGDQGVWDNTSLVLDAADRPMIAYSKISDELRLATRQDTGWVSEVVSLESVEALDMALDSAGLPRIAYVAWDGSAYVLRLATFDGASWTFETIGHVSLPGYEFAVDLALDSKDRAHIAFPVYDPVEGMSFARQSETGWEVELLREGPSWQPALTLDDADTGHLVFYDATDGALVYAQRVVDGAWAFQIVEDDPSPSIRIGRGPSIALDARNRPHVSYYLGDQAGRTFLKLAASTSV